jgi:pyruvate formate lyase activating enzyme
MIIKGLDRFSLIDYPGKIAAIVFVSGCNFRCPYCHNPHLVLDGSAQPRISERAILEFLDSRKGRIDGVVVSGGEPTLQKNLPVFLEKVKARGYLAKVDTNGSRPERLAELIEAGLLDAVGIDYKAPMGRYNDVAKSREDDVGEKVSESIRLCVEKEKLLELKTTVHRKLLSHEDLLQMRRELDALGAKKWILQQFHRAETLDGSINDEESYSDVELANFAKSMHWTRARGIKGIFFE